ncbi:crosslink repair DNA glycosylase YcaQ family protein [Brachybacterium rhamnosum]|uniref:DNA glycosylase AlkZ-like family protein n=1 Tax=Brachybacterium rhamnosum TaxID=173361 RepID=A0ABW4PW42_9MICO
MTPRHLVGARLLAQGLLAPDGAPPTPVEVARSFAAHQGQDLPGAVSSLALRSRAPRARTGTAAVQQVLDAFDRGEIVRGYPMRGTVFVVAADSLAWITELCAAGPLRAQVARRPALGLDQDQVDRARAVLEEVAGPRSSPGTGRGVPRAELLAAWEAAGLATAKGRGYHLLSHLVALGVAAYGPWRDGDTAVVLARRWLPAGSDLEGAFGGDRVAAVAELARRYVTSRGPVTERDLAWWSKLTLGEIRAAWPAATRELESGYADRDGRLHARAEDARGGDGERRWFRAGLVEEYAEREKEAMAELLLPGFDELVLGYRDRGFLGDEARVEALVPGGNGVFRRPAIRRGEIVGTWRRAGSGARRRLEIEELTPLTAPQLTRFTRLHERFPAVGG